MVIPFMHVINSPYEQSKLAKKAKMFVLYSEKKKLKNYSLKRNSKYNTALYCCRVVISKGPLLSGWGGGGGGGRYRSEFNWKIN